MNKRKKSGALPLFFLVEGEVGQSRSLAARKTVKKPHKNATILYSLLIFSLGGGEIF
jgi:hypothetical protein